MPAPAANETGHSGLLDLNRTGTALEPGADHRCGSSLGSCGKRSASGDGDASDLARRQRQARLLEDQGSRQAHFPTHLLAGSMVCGSCGATIAQVSGKSGGYYGCLAATKGACDNTTLVRHTLAEKVILGAVQEQIAGPEHIAYVLQRVEHDIAKLRSDLPETLKLKEAELTVEDRRPAKLRRLHRRGPW
jgi:hypothetical protein